MGRWVFEKGRAWRTKTTDEECPTGCHAVFEYRQCPFLSLLVVVVLLLLVIVASFYCGLWVKATVARPYNDSG